MTKRADSVDVLVGQRVRAYRLNCGMSQTVLGKKVGVTFQQIQKYERGVNRIGSGRLKRIATILGVSVAALFGEGADGGNATVDDLLTAVLSQPYATRLLRAFDDIKDAQQRRAYSPRAWGTASNKDSWHQLASSAAARYSYTMKSVRRTGGSSLCGCDRGAAPGYFAD